MYSYYLFAQILTEPGYREAGVGFGGDLTLMAPAVVPEPATVTLLASGLVVACRAKRRKRAGE